MPDVPSPKSLSWMTPDDCSISDFRSLTQRGLSADSVPRAAEILRNVPVYDGPEITQLADAGADLRPYLAEWNWCFSEGPGIVAFRGAYGDTDLIDAVTDVFNQIIEQEEATAEERGDHFALSGANSRIWNAHEKLCAAAPELFIRYNANPIVPLISRAWLGPHFQVTTQVNVVRPGGKAQTCHRDYHMGFLPNQTLADFPPNAHHLSASLTLQGAVAHTPMPLESGPTKLLPYSQIYAPGYMAVHLPAFQDCFEENFVQLPLEKGDAFFFNPAVFHAAGDNVTQDLHRLANLMQIGSAFGRSIEIVNRTRICRLIFAPLKHLHAQGELSAREIEDVIAASAEGYPFPTDLDQKSPTNSMIPQSQQELLRQAIAEGWEERALERALLT